MKKIFSVLLSVLIGYGALKLYLYYDIKNTLDTLIAKSEPFIQIQYHDFATFPFKGMVTVSGISVKAPGNQDTIYIQRATINGLEFYPPNKQSVQPFDFSKPTLKTINLQGVSNKPNSNFISKVINRSTPPNYKVSFAPKNISLDKLGYSNILSDVTISLMPLQNQKHMRIDYKQTNQDMFTLALSLTVNIPNTPLIQNLKIYEGTLKYQDHSLFKKWIKSSALAHKISLNAMQKKVIQDLDDSFASKITLSQSNLSAIESFIINPKTLSIQISPYDPLNFESLSMLRLYNPNDIPKILNLNITSE
jgi:hypothetical protein